MALEHPVAQPPAYGGVLPIAPGILWLRMPLPFALNHVNLWVIEDGAGWALIDTGFPDDATCGLWELAIAGPLRGRPLTRLVVSHFHPDHMGLADWFARRYAVPLEAPMAEWLFGRMLSMAGGETFVQASLDFYHAAGVDQPGLEMIARRGNAYGSRVKRVPVGVRRIRHGDILVLGGHRWQVMTGEGHSPEQACLWCEELGVLIAGDQILPSISPNVSVWPTEPDADPLRLFLASLGQFRQLPPETLVLPSHGLPFRGLHARLDQLAHHHDQRLAETLDVCRHPTTAFELINTLFRRKLDDHQFFFALGESLAHLHALAGEGRLARTTDSHGVHRFERV